MKRDSTVRSQVWLVSSIALSLTFFDLLVRYLCRSWSLSRAFVLVLVLNLQGGKWILQIKSSSAAAREILDKYWENTLLALIGETLDEQDDICGVGTCGMHATTSDLTPLLISADLLIFTGLLVALSPVFY